MRPITTAEEFLEGLPADLRTAKLARFEFIPEHSAQAAPTMEWITVVASFRAWWLAENKDDALWAAKCTLDVIRGRKAIIRVPPEADSVCDFATEKWEHRGYVRASFVNEPGEWEYPTEGPQVRYLPLASLKGKGPSADPNPKKDWTAASKEHDFDPVTSFCNHCGIPRQYVIDDLLLAGCPAEYVYRRLKPSEDAPLSERGFGV